MARARFLREPLTIVDTRTSLEWSASLVATDVAWAEAVSVATKARLAGGSGWRLPHKAELLELGKVGEPALRRAGFELMDRRGRSGPRGVRVRVFAADGPVMVVNGRTDALAGFVWGDFGLFDRAAVLLVRGRPRPVATPRTKAETEALRGQFDRELEGILSTVVAHTRVPANARERAALLDEVWQTVETAISDLFTSEDAEVIRGMIAKTPRIRARFEAELIERAATPGRRARRGANPRARRP